MPRLDSYADLTLLAQRSAWDALGTRFQGEYIEFRAADIFVGVAILAGLAVGFYLLRFLGEWQEKSQQKSCPKRLMAELCDAHRLGFRERRLCRLVAKEMQLKEPAELFVRTDALKRLAQHDAALAKRLLGHAA